MANPIYEYEWLPLDPSNCPVVCDLRGNWVTTNSYSAGNHYRIDPMIAQYETEDDLKQRQFDEALAQISREFLLRRLPELAEKAGLSEIQRCVFNGLLLGKTRTQLARERGCSVSALCQVIYGNSKGQGGLIRKLKKAIRNLEETTSNATDR